MGNERDARASEGNSNEYYSWSMQLKFKRRKLNDNFFKKILHSNICCFDYRNGLLPILFYKKF
jgi:hypothetical protein